MTSSHKASFRIALLCLICLFWGGGAQAQSGTTYNGIVLPPLWPPVGGPTQAYQIPTYITNPPAVIPIDVGRQLFVDDFLIQQTTMTRTQHQPVMYPGNPILSPGPLDTLNSAFPYSDGVWFDPADQTFKMWYYCGDGSMVCYAYSSDGKNWIKPSYSDAVIPNSNIVLQIGTWRDSDTVWMDLQDPNPAQKFKLFAYQNGLPYGMLSYFSADGIHWVEQRQSAFPIKALWDRTTLFQNPFRNVWVDSEKNYVLLPASGGRPAYLSRLRYYVESPDLVSWTPSDYTDSFWTGPDVNDPPYPGSPALPQLYNLDAVAYESLTVGLFSWFYPGPVDSDPSGIAGPDLVELGVGFSRDGFQWVRPTRGAGPTNAFIPASNTAGTWNMGNTQSAGGGFVVVGDELWFYFSGRNQPHSVAGVGATGLATLRRDGFYSMDAAATGATLTTRPMQFSGKYVFVNVKAPQGSLQIQAIDCNNHVVANSAQLANIDKTLQAVTWNEIPDLSTVCQPAQFRFTMTNGSLYSFWVTSSSTGASNGYVGANGPGFGGPKDTKGSTAYPTTAATPEIFPAGVPFAKSMSVSITTGTLGASVHYTLDGSPPTVSSPVYAGPIQISNTTTVRAISTGPGLSASAAVSATFPLDNIPPVVSMAAPLAAHIVSGAMVLTANASDNFGVAGVQFLVDGNPVATVTTAPYSSTVNTTVFTNAAHLITAVATDIVGNQTTSLPVVVTVDNVTSGPISGLIGYWSFDPAFVSGTTLLDQSGSNNNLAANNTNFVTGQIGQALQFNGSTSSAQIISGTSAYDVTGSMSFSLWLQTTNSTRTEGIINKYAGADSGYGYMLVSTAQGVLQLVLGGANTIGGSTAVSDTTRINDGKWHHITVVVNLGANVIFFIDGALSSASTLLSKAGPAAAFFQLGSDPFGSNFTGNMDEVRVYNRALSAADVLALAQPYAPSISITSPTNGVIASGSLTVTASATDAAGIANVQFQVDGATAFSATTAPYTFNLDTTTLTNSGHQITAIATDNEGNQATSTAVPMTVNNVYWYVSPTGTPSGNGSLANPWDLQTALNQPSVVQPGSTIWLLGGVYYGDFLNQLNGTAASPIIVRNYPGQRVTLNGFNGSQGIVLWVYGSYTWFWGLEVTDLTDPRTGPAFGVGVYGPGIKFINTVVHDTGEGFSAYNASPNAEFSGNVVYYNGSTSSTRNFGHGMYLQNDTGTKLVSNNFVGDNGFEGIQIYGSGTANIIGFNVTGNTLYDTDSWPTPNYQYNLIIAGGATRQNIQVTNNYSYFPLAANTGEVNVGQYTLGLDATVQNNVFVGGNSAFSMDGQSGPVSFTNNIVYSGPSAAETIRLALYSGQSYSSYNWNNNTYYGANIFTTATYNSDGSFSNTRFQPFTSWQSQTGLDRNSTFTSSSPSGTWIYVQPNMYEAKRANITVYNWALASTVSVNLSNVLSYGDQYVVLDAQNIYGPAVATGTYTGTPISVPMTGLTKAVPSGLSPPAHTAPTFGTFIVQATSSTLGIEITPIVTTLYANQTQQFTGLVQALAGQSVNWTVSPSLGTISSSGFYTAPSTIAAAQNITVTATSSSNPALSATALIVLMPPISVTVSPTTVTLNQGGTQQFTDTVQNTLTTGVTWSISPNVGSISSSGLYTAPASLTAAQSVTVTATSVANSAAFGTATVNLNPPVLVFLAPSAVGINPGQTQQFTASVQNTSNQSVTWQISPSGAGTVTPTGPNTATYTAPTGIPTGEIVTLTATSVAYPTLSASSTINVSLVTLTPPPGLSLYWSFDTSTISASQVADLSGSGGTGTISGTAISVPGKINQALSFNGSNSSVSTGPYAAIAFNNSITLGAWIKTANTSRTEAIISKFSAGGSGAGYIFRTDANGFLEVSFGANDLASNPSAAVDTTVVNDGNWHYVAAVVTIGQDVKFYVDGNFSSSTLVSTVANGDGNASLFVGVNPYTPYGNYFTGSIDEVRVYNQALTAAQISVLYQLSGGPPPPISVSVSPATATLNKTQTQQFTATIVDAANQSVTWKVSPTGVGSLAPTGASTATYTPPATIAAAQTVTVTATSVADTTKSGTASISLITSIANFVSPPDVTTQGNWASKYGADGYAFANGPQNIPGYATLAVQNAGLYTWNSNTTDVRGLTIPGGSGRLAACWYSNPGFSFDLNISDGNLHPIALYLLDWDSFGGVPRAETIQILDAATNAVIDTRTVSNLVNGIYLVWNISGHVKINVNWTAGANGVVSAVFFGGVVNPAVPSVTWPAPASIIYGTALSGTQLDATASVPGVFSYSPAAGTVLGAGSQTLSVTFNPTDTIDYAPVTTSVPLTVSKATPTITWTTPTPITFGTALTSAQLNASASVPGSFAYSPASGTVLGVGSQPLSVTFTPTDATDYQVATASVTLVVNPVAQTTAASFVGTDATTGGSWVGVYGADGYALAGGPQSLPSYDPSFAVTNAQSYTYTTTTSDVRALQNGASRLAAVWYSGTSFSFDVNITDGNTHQLAVYALDWDSYGGTARGETIQIVNAVTGATLDSRSITNCTGGVYEVWNVSGHVTVKVSWTAGANAVVNGVFFGGGITPQSVNLSASQQQTFTAKVGGTTNQTVTWTLNPNVGTIVSSGASTGLYTAPGTITSGQTVTVTATASGVTVGSAAVNLSTTTSVGTAASFVGTDPTTGGSWVGVYGADGYALAGGPQSLPSYDPSFAATNAQSYTYTTTTSDVRALQNGASRLAAVWYSGTSFSFDVNITDGNTHQLAVYALDWDSYGGTARGETIQIVNAATGATLDSRSITNCTGGVYEVWNVSGHVTVKVNWTAGANAVVNGVFFGGGITPQSVNLSASQQQTFTAKVGGTTNQTVTWTLNPNVGTIVSSGASTGLYTAPGTITSGQTVTVTATASGVTVGSAAVNLSTTTSVGTAASFVGTDPTTGGSWVGVYGADGYALAGGPQSLPSYDPSFAATNAQSYTYTTTTSDVRALQNGASRLAAVWYSGTSFSFDVNITDGNTHQLAVYALDWDSYGGTARGETIQIVNAATGATLDSRSITNCTGGVYEVWNVSGHVTVKVNWTAGANAVVNGVFFGGGSASASFGGTDTTTQGSWAGKYGVDGYSLANGPQSLPGYAALSVQNNLNYTWVSGTSDPRALQIPNGTGGLVSVWYNNPTFSLDINLTDGNTHRIALYLLDWDSFGGVSRAETIQILNAATNQVLSTQNVANFTTGTYLYWNITGHVKVNVIWTAGANAVLNGVFFK